MTITLSDLGRAVAEHSVELVQAAAVDDPLRAERVAGGLVGGERRRQACNLEGRPKRVSLLESPDCSYGIDLLSLLIHSVVMKTNAVEVRANRWVPSIICISALYRPFHLSRELSQRAHRKQSRRLR